MTLLLKRGDKTYRIANTNINRDTGNSEYIL